MTRKYNNPFRATYHGIINMISKKEPFGILNPEDRIDGKICLVTGANSGLGFAIARELAIRGGRVIMACRSGIPKAGQRINQLLNEEKTEMIKVDLSDLQSIKHFTDQIKEKGIMFDIIVCNAAIVPSGSRKTKQGFDEMFVVNYLAKFFLLNQLYRQGSINFDASSNPRIIVINSESHRSGADLETLTLGEFFEYRMSRVMDLYSYYKLALMTFTREFSRRMNKDTTVRAGIHSICPGAVNTRIAREAPLIVQPLLKLVFAIFFQKPSKAAQPVIYLCCSKVLEGQTNHYLHMWTKKEIDSRAINSDLGEQLWDRTLVLLKNSIDQAGSLS